MRNLAVVFGIGSASSVRRHRDRHMSKFTPPPSRDFRQEVAVYLQQHPQVGAEIAGEQPGGAA